MIVDDSKSMRMIVKRTLKQAGYDDMEFEEADDGTDALEKIDGYGPELVLCDWNMPTMNGIDFLKAIREAGNNVKFGFVTTESTAEMNSPTCCRCLSGQPRKRKTPLPPPHRTSVTQQFISITRVRRWPLAR